MTPLLDDPIKYLSEHPEAEATIIKDPVSGYRRPIFREEFLAEVAEELAHEVKTTLDEYEAKIWPKTRKNIDTYEGRQIKDEIITIPFARRDTNNQHAWLTTTIFAKQPVSSCRAIVYGEIPYIEPSAQADPITQEQVTVPIQKTLPSPEFAQRLTDFLEVRTETQIPFRKIVSDFILDALKDGNTPAVLKNIYEPAYREQTAYEPVELIEPVMMSGEAIYDEMGAPMTRKRVILDEVTRRVLDGPPNQIVHVNRFDFIQPLDEPNTQTARWCGHLLVPMSPTELRRKFEDGTFDLCRAPGTPVTEEEIDEILAEELESPGEQPKAPKFWPDKAAKAVRPIEVWFFLPVQTDKGIEILNLCATLGLRSKKLFNCYVNWLRTGERPFELLFKGQRPHELSGTSAVEDAMPFQNLVSLIFHSYLNNLAIANTMVFKVRKTSSAYTFLNPQGSVRAKIRPGTIVPVDDDDDFKGMPMGTPVQSSMEPITFLDAQAQILGNRTEIDRGAIPSRTPAATVAQVTTQARMQPAQFLDVIREALGNSLRRYVEIEAQYNPYGVEIPFADSKGIVSNVLVQMPAAPLADQFAVQITATAEDETREAMFERNTVLSGLVSKANQEAFLYGQVMFSPQAPPPAQQFAMFLLARSEKVLARLLRSRHPDADKDTFDLAELEGYLRQFQQWSQQQMLKMLMQQQGGMNAGAGANPGGAVPGPSGGPPRNLAMGRELGNAGASPPDSLAAVPVGPVGADVLQ